MKININLENIKYDISVKELAEVIWEMTDEEQMELLYKLATVSSHYNILMQMQNMSDVRLDKPMRDKINSFVLSLNAYMNGD